MDASHCRTPSLSEIGPNHGRDLRMLHGRRHGRAAQCPVVTVASGYGRRRMDTTWDGVPITPEWPRGASVVVRRPDGDVLLLHRAHHGADYEGPWGWTTPAGSRQPGEAILASAHRELAEEADLHEVDVVPVDLGGHWALFVAEVP